MPIEHCAVLEKREDNFPPARCAFVLGHGGEHRFPMKGEDLSGEIRLRVALDAALARAEQAEKLVAEGLDRDEGRREEFEAMRSEASTFGKEVDRLHKEVHNLQRELEAATGLADTTALKDKEDAIYRERNTCVAVIARLSVMMGFTAGLAQHDEKDTSWDSEWRNIVYIEIPFIGRWQQLSWHFHDRDMPMFSWLREYKKPWDGHTTEQKYVEMIKFARKEW